MLMITWNAFVDVCRCHIAVHEDCYGVRAAELQGSFTCRACENPDIEHECCLCPVKGMGLHDEEFGHYLFFKQADEFTI
jgi:hypothetical protein